MSKHLFQALASTADGALVTDSNQCVIYWNRTAESVLGHRPGEIETRPCYEVLDGQDVHGRLICRQECSALVAGIAGSQVPNFDICVHTKSGDTCWINVSTFVFPSGRQGSLPLLVHLFRDVTRRTQTEELLSKVLIAADRLLDGHGAHDHPQAPTFDAGAELTEREHEVLSLLALGRSTGEMAKALYISTSTVRNHIRSILLKFQVHSRIEAVLYAVKRGLISID